MIANIPAKENKAESFLFIALTRSATLAGLDASSVSDDDELNSSSDSDDDELCKLLCKVNFSIALLHKN